MALTIGPNSYPGAASLMDMSRRVGTQDATGLSRTIALVDGPSKSECDAWLHDIYTGLATLLQKVLDLQQRANQNPSSVSLPEKLDLIDQISALQVQLRQFLAQCGNKGYYDEKALGRIRGLDERLNDMRDQVRDPSGMGKAVVEAILAAVAWLSGATAPLVPNPDGMPSPAGIPLF